MLEQRVANRNIRVAVMQIIKDIQDRRGLGDEWNQIDNETLKEIKETWYEIIEINIHPCLRSSYE
jgi:hypothetical protein